MDRNGIMTVAARTIGSRRGMAAMLAALAFAPAGAAVAQDVIDAVPATRPIENVRVGPDGTFETPPATPTPPAAVPGPVPPPATTVPTVPDPDPTVATPDAEVAAPVDEAARPRTSRPRAFRRDIARRPAARRTRSADRVEPAAPAEAGAAERVAPVAEAPVVPPPVVDRPVTAEVAPVAERPAPNARSSTPWLLAALAGGGIVAAALFAAARRRRRTRLAGDFASSEIETFNQEAEDLLDVDASEELLLDNPVPAEPAQGAPEWRRVPSTRALEGEEAIATPVAAAADTLVTPGVAAAIERPRLRIDFRPAAARATDTQAVVEFDVTVTNGGDSPVRDVRLEALMLAMSGDHDAALAEFFAAPLGRPTSIAAHVSPGASAELRAQVALPRDAVQPIRHGDRLLFVPLVAFNILYEWGHGETGQVTASYVVGRENRPPVAKMAPFRLDLGPRTYREVGQRVHQARQLA